MIVRRQLLALGVLGTCAWAPARASSEASLAEQKLQSLLRPPTPSASGAPADASRQAERAALLQAGEAALARLDTDAAEAAFDRAALIAHAADTEMGLVRTYMQAGTYRRALAFGAHTAGAHLDAMGGTALYAWLLDAGGQQEQAQRLLQQAAVRAPGQPLLAGVTRALGSNAPVADAILLAPPVRLAPYGQAAGARAETVGSALLVDGGQRALAPLAALSRPGALWLRNGLGQLASAHVERRLLAGQLAVLRLDKPLPEGEPLTVASRDAFPGSVALAAEYVAGHGAQARWPLLRTGFVGMPADGAALAPLGVALAPGPRGGPVFDAAGRLVGLAQRDARGSDRLLPVSQLQAAVGGALGARAQGTAPVSALGPRVPLDQVYEQSLRCCLQLIAAR